MTDRERALMQITGSWLDHVNDCHACQDEGVRWCPDAHSLLAIMRINQVEPREARP